MNKRSTLVVMLSFMLIFSSVSFLLSSINSVANAQDSSPTIEGQYFQPINPETNEKTRNLLAYLYSIKGKGILSGQHEYLETPDSYSNGIKSVQGDYQAIQGYELGPISNQTAQTAHTQRQALVDSAIKWNKAGGIVALSWHMKKPLEKYDWSKIQSSMTQESFNRILQTGTPENIDFLKEADLVAGYISQLRDANVPVIFRPFHEMNGGWFWWGNQPKFTELWDMLYDRYTNYHKLNNIIWYWTPNAPNQSSSALEPYFPGANKVDMLGLDIYDKNYMHSYYETLVKLGRGKVTGIAENGELPNVADLISEKEHYVAQMSWGSMLAQKNTAAVQSAFFKNPYVINRSKVIYGKRDATKLTPCYMDSAESAMINLAYQKKVFTSTMNNPTTTTLITDGNLKTQWVAGNTSADQSIAIDLGGIYKFSEVMIAWGNAASKYTIETSNDATTWNVINSVTNGNGGEDYIRDLNGEGRFVRVKTSGKTHNWSLSVGEIKVLSNDEIRYFSNVSLPISVYRTVVTSGNSAWGDAVSGINDGDTTTRWASEIAPKTSFTLDLDDVYSVDSLNFVWDNQKPSKYHIEYSIDGEIYTPIAETQGTVSLNNYTGLTTIARYLKFVVDVQGGNGLSRIREFTANGVISEVLPHATVKAIEPTYNYTLTDLVNTPEIVLDIDPNEPTSL